MKLFQAISNTQPVLPRRRIIFAGIFIHLLVLSVLAIPTVVPTPTEQAVEYHNINNIAWGVNKVLPLLWTIAFIFFGFGARISDRFLTHGKYRTFGMISALLFTVNWLIQLPFERFRLNTRNELENNPSLPVLQWTLNQFLESLPLIALSILASLFVYWLINKSPQKWWLWATGVFSLLFLVFLVCEPFTLSYQPLGESPIEVKITKLAEQIGIPKDSIVLEDCEPFDKCEIAHASGLGPSRIILLNKGLFQNYPDSWTIQTFAHESKHYLKDDNLTGSVVLMSILLVGFWLVDRICRAIINRFFDKLGFDSLGQAAALPLLTLVLNILFLIALPPINLFRQHVEFEADRFGLQLTGENVVLAEMASSWTTKSKLRMPDPSRFFMLFRSSHPSDAARISFANEFPSKDKHH